MRTTVIQATLAALPLLAGCAAGSGSGSSGAAALAYQAPDATSLSYTQADSAVLTIDAGGQMLDVLILSNAVMDMAFSPADRGLEVTATWRTLDAQVTNPMGAPESTDQDDVDGPVVFTLDRQGNAEVVSVPALRGTARQMVTPEAVAHSFFPGLPGTAPTPGMTWTDTVSFETDSGEASTVNRTVMTYTVAGDSLVDGRSFLKVAMEGQGSTLQEGATQGMSFLQELSGDVTGWFLWDLADGTMYAQYSESIYRGTMEMAAAPFPLGVAMRATSRVVRGN